MKAMKLTKKQLAALHRIVGREQARYDEIESEAHAGFHSGKAYFAVTDGAMVLLYRECPDGIPVGDPSAMYENAVQNYLIGSNAQLVTCPPTVDDCKKVIREWNGTKKLSRPAFPKITITTEDKNGISMTSYFDARRCLDILESAGPYHNVYMGYSDTMKTPLPCLLVYKRNGRDVMDDVNWDEPAFLLPCRV